MKFRSAKQWASTPEQKASLRQALSDVSPAMARVLARQQPDAQPELAVGRSRAGEGSPLPGAPLERDVQKAVVQAMRALGWRVVRMNVGAARTEQGFVTFGERGMPDLWCFKAGRALLLEIKRPGMNLAAHQRDWHEAARPFVPCAVVHGPEEAILAARGVA